MSETIVLVDLSSISRPIFEASGREPDPDYVSNAIVARVRELAAAHRHTVICCDSGRSFRHDISADYKANRHETPGAYLHQVRQAQEMLKADGFPVWSAKGFEADDLIASAVGALNYSGTKDIFRDVLIISADKDLRQLVNERVSVLRLEMKPYTKEKLFDVAAVKEEYGVEPSQFLDYLSLCGDGSDNVKGAVGIGPKIAEKLLTKFGNIEDLYAAIDKGGFTATPKAMDSLLEFRTRLPSVRSLLTLRTDVPLPFDEIFKERIPADVATGDDMSHHDETVKYRDDIDESMPTLGGQDGQGHGTTKSPAPEEKTGGRDYKGNSGTPAPVLQGEVIAARRVEPAGAPDSDAQGQALTPVEWDKQLEPRTMVQADWLAKQMFTSRIFGAYGTPQAVLSTILAGRELGMTAMASLRAFHLIENKPTLSSGVIMALVLKSGKAEYFRCSERTPERATFVTKRKGDPEPISLTYTIEDARRAWQQPADKFEKGNYGRNPADMLSARAGSKLARLVYPDVVSGLYAPDEFDKETS